MNREAKLHTKTENESRSVKTFTGVDETENESGSVKTFTGVDELRSGRNCTSKESHEN